jgi:hypothetical protein
LGDLGSLQTRYAPIPRKLLRPAANPLQSALAISPLSGDICPMVLFVKLVLALAFGFIILALL